MRDSDSSDIPHVSWPRVERNCFRKSTEPYSPECKNNKTLSVYGQTILGPPHDTNPVTFHLLLRKDCNMFAYCRDRGI